MNNVVVLPPALPVSRETEPAPITKNLDYFVCEIGKRWHQTKEVIFQVADLCAEAAATLGISDLTRLSEQTDFGKGVISKLVRISHDPRLRRETIYDHLPNHYTILYEVARLSDVQLTAALAEGIIKPDMRRADLKAWLPKVDDKDGEPESVAKIVSWEDASGIRLAAFQASLRKAIVGFPEFEVRGKGDKWSIRGGCRIIRPEAA